MKRNSKIELLRILCMMGITAHHMVYHSDILSQPLGVSRLFAQFFLLFGKSGVNLFVLISGYYLAGNPAIDYRRSAGRVLKTWKRVILYSVLLLGAALLINHKAVTFRFVLESLLPTVTNHYWFLTAYIGLLILEPFLNRLVHAMDESDFRKLMLALVLMLCVPLKSAPWNSHLVWFIALYFTAAYLRLYKPRWLTTQRRRLLAAIGCFAFMWLFSVAVSLVAEKHPWADDYVNFLAMRPQNPFMYVGSVAIFLYAAALKPAETPWINRAAKHVLACYLVQSNNFFYRLIWGFVNAHIPKQGFGYPLAVAVVVPALIAACMALDALLDAIGASVRRLAAAIRRR